MSSFKSKQPFAHDYQTRVAMAGEFLAEQFFAIHATTLEYSKAAGTASDYPRLSLGLFIAALQSKEAAERIAVNFCNCVYGEDATMEAMRDQGLHILNSFLVA